jgi:hypothetical protein
MLPKIILINLHNNSEAVTVSVQYSEKEINLKPGTIKQEVII